MTDLISPDDLVKNGIHLDRTPTVDDLVARIDRLERFITQSYDWPAMLTDSNLNDTIKHTVDHNFWIDISAKLRGGD